ncbi:MAG: TonB-dependent receptor, partial [Marivirga sp.]|nr:TonB-dependent receptor [Marivirga sp.]
NPQHIVLPELIVTDYLTEGITKKPEGSFQIISGNLGILPGLIEPDVLQTIQALPGIQSIDETISNINVRGGTNDQNLVLWDGIKMYQTGHFFGLISAFNPYLTQRISLVKNGTSSSFSDGVSSTIDIHSIDTVATKFSGGMGINMINGDFFLRIPLSKKLAIQLSSRRSIADAIKTPAYDQYFSRTFRDTDVTGNNTSGGDTVITTKKDFYFYDVNVKVLYDITDRDRLRVNFLKINNEITYQENSQGNNIIESKTSSLSQTSNAAGLSYDRLWNDRVKTFAEGYLSHYQLDGINFDIFNEQKLQQKNEVLDLGVKLGVLLSLNKRTDLYTGYQFSEVGVSNSDDINNPPFSRLVKRVLHTHTAFIEGSYSSYSNSTNLRSGVRINYIPKFDKILIEPRLAFSHRLGEAITLEMLGEIKSQTTTQIIDFQNDFLGVEKRRWIISDNEEIPVVTSRQVSTGIIYNWNGLLVSLEGYLKKVNGITTSSQGFQNQFQFVRSSGGYFTKGIDFIVNKKFNKVSTWLSYSLAYNDFEFSELVPPMFPNNLDIRHNTSIGGSYRSSRIEVSTGLRWRTGKPFTEPDQMDPVTGNTINYQSPNSSRLEDYLRVDVSVKYNFHLGHSIKAQVGGSIW